MGILKAYAAYLAVMWLLAFVLCGIDKWKAQRGRWRVPEKTLFLVSGLGGAWGFLLGMAVFRHKTKHRSFQIGIPLMAVLWLAVSVWLVWALLLRP